MLLILSGAQRSRRTHGRSPASFRREHSRPPLSTDGRLRHDGPRMAWDPRQYLKFSSERLRPGFDLLAQVGELPPGPIFELGCGTGPHARAMAQHWPERTIIAIDKSKPMLAEAAAEPSTVRWLEADIAGWSAPEP